MLAVYGGLAVIAWRRPLLGRLAWREAVRRSGHSALLVAGMMFGTAAILRMQGIGDSLQKGITGNITTAWGRTDITGVDVPAFARALRIATFNQGVEVVTQSELIDVNNKWTAWFSGVFTTLLKAAVVVGVLSFGILALRAAIEWRRTIGVLRALGYRPRQVLGGLLTEALITTTVGVAAGVGIGFAIGWAYVTGAGITRPHVDIAQVLVPALLIYAAVLLVTIGPAVQASRMRTSEALRIVG